MAVPGRNRRSHAGHHIRHQRTRRSWISLVLERRRRVTGISTRRTSPNTVGPVVDAHHQVRLPLRECNTQLCDVKCRVGQDAPSQRSDSVPADRDDCTGDVRDGECQPDICLAERPNRELGNRNPDQAEQYHAEGHHSQRSLRPRKLPV